MSINTPLVSIGIPTYNRPQELKECIDSILKQSHKNIEVIISDNSEDSFASLQILEEFNDERVIYFHQPSNIGIINNLFFVLEKSTGDYFHWVSDDDWRSSSIIEYSLKALINSGTYTSAVISDYSVSNKYGEYCTDYLLNHRGVFESLSSLYIIKVLQFMLFPRRWGLCNFLYAFYRRNDLMEAAIIARRIGFDCLYMDSLIAITFITRFRFTVLPEKHFMLLQGNIKHYREINNTKKALVYSGKRWQMLTFYYNHIRCLPKNKYRSIFQFLLPVFFIYNKLIERYPDFQRKIKIILGKEKGRSVSSEYITWQRSYLSAYNPNPVSASLSIVCVATKDVEQSGQAFLYSLAQCDFKNSLFFATHKPYCFSKSVLAKNIEFIPISEFSSVEDWGKFIVFDLYSYISTTHILLIHADGFVVNPDKWNDQFLDYDYIGAPFPKPRYQSEFLTPDGRISNVGNSVSIRSQKLLKIPSTLNMTWTSPIGSPLNEDGYLCVYNKTLLETNGINFAPKELALQFSVENYFRFDKIPSFAFHKWENINSKYPRF